MIQHYSITLRGEGDKVSLILRKAISALTELFSMDQFMSGF